MRAGEIVGLAGVDANGQSELIEAITGLRHVESGAILIDGEDVTGRSPREMIDAGVGHIAEDRHRARPRAPVRPGREHLAARLPQARR